MSVPSKRYTTKNHGIAPYRWQFAVAPLVTITDLARPNVVPHYSGTVTDIPPPVVGLTALGYPSFTTLKRGAFNQRFIWPTG